MLSGILVNWAELAAPKPLIVLFDRRTAAGVPPTSDMDQIDWDKRLTWASAGAADQGKVTVVGC
jgi:hypothetical protein